MKKYAPEGIVSENMFEGFASLHLKLGALPQMVLLPNPLLAVPLTHNDPILAWRATSLINEM